MPERNWGSPVVIGVLPSKARVAPVQDLGVARACPVVALVDLGVTGCSLGVAWVWAGGVGGVLG